MEAIVQNLLYIKNIPCHCHVLYWLETSNDGHPHPHLTVNHLMAVQPRQTRRVWNGRQPLGTDPPSQAVCNARCLVAVFKVHSCYFGLLTRLTSLAVESSVRSTLHSYFIETGSKSGSNTILQCATKQSAASLPKKQFSESDTYNQPDFEPSSLVLGGHMQSECQKQCRHTLRNIWRDVCLRRREKLFL